MKSTDVLGMEGRRRRRRLRWEDCVKRDLAGAEGENESEGWGSGDGWTRRWQ